MLAQMKLQLHFSSLGSNNQLKNVRKKIIELAAASVSCLSQLLCCPLLLLHRLRCKLKSCPSAPGWYTHRVHARLLFAKRWKKDSDGVLEQPVCEAPCPGAGAVWRPPSLGQQVAAVAHSLGGDLITTLSSRQVKRWSWSWSKWIASSTKKKCGVSEG